MIAFLIPDDYCACVIRAIDAIDAVKQACMLNGKGRFLALTKCMSPS